MKPVRIAVIGAGSFGKNHIRALAGLPAVELAAIVDTDPAMLAALTETRGAALLTSLDGLPGCDAAIVATPTSTHEQVAAALLERGLDVLVEKPIAHSAEAGRRLTHSAAARGRILQVGHLERFNPAVTSLTRSLTVPLFFEVHRLNTFAPRSLDIDVVLDLMIHDLDIVLTLARQWPSEIRAAGISVLSSKVDIANVRLAFPTGCIANLTASRVSTERVRKLRVFQPHQYISLDYARQEAACFSVYSPSEDASASELPRVDFRLLDVTKAEPLAVELGSFVQAVRERNPPVVDGEQATAALALAEEILANIKEHGHLVSQSITGSGSGQPSPGSFRR